MINLKSVKSQLKIEPSDEQEADLLVGYILAATSYAEQYQTKNYSTVPFDDMKATTEQAILMLISHWYDNRDGTDSNSSGYASANTNAATIQAVNRLLYFDRVIHV